LIILLHFFLFEICKFFLAKIIIILQKQTLFFTLGLFHFFVFFSKEVVMQKFNKAAESKFGKPLLDHNDDFAEILLVRVLFGVGFFNLERGTSGEFHCWIIVGGERQAQAGRSWLFLYPLSRSIPQKEYQNQASRTSWYSYPPNKS
jgi:hypothetical protein